MLKSKKTLEMSLDLMPRSRPPLIQGLRVLFQIWIIWKIGAVILLKKNMTEQDICWTHTFCSLDFNRFLLYKLFTPLMTPKGK